MGQVTQLWGNLSSGATEVSVVTLCTPTVNLRRVTGSSLRQSLLPPTGVWGPTVLLFGP